MKDTDRLKEVIYRLSSRLSPADRLDLAQGIVAGVMSDGGIGIKEVDDLLPTTGRLAEKVSHLPLQEEADTVGHGLMLVYVQLHALLGSVEDVEWQEAPVPATRRSECLNCGQRLDRRTAETCSSCGGPGL